MQGSTSEARLVISTRAITDLIALDTATPAQMLTTTLNATLGSLTAAAVPNTFSLQSLTVSAYARRRPVLNVMPASTRFIYEYAKKSQTIQNGDAGAVIELPTGYTYQSMLMTFKDNHSYIDCTTDNALNIAKRVTVYSGHNKPTFETSGKRTRLTALKRGVRIPAAAVYLPFYDSPRVSVEAGAQRVLTNVDFGTATVATPTVECLYERYRITG